MSPRSCAVHRLARHLGERTGLLVAARWSRNLHEWSIVWRDGPAEAEMRLMAVSIGSEQLTPVDIADLTFYRRLTPEGEAVALLLYLDSHRDQLSLVNTHMKHWAAARASYPERAGEVWQRRARALATVEHAFYALARHAPGRWETTLAWLDAIEPPRLRGVDKAHAPHSTTLKRELFVNAP